MTAFCYTLEYFYHEHCSVPVKMCRRLPTAQYLSWISLERIESILFCSHDHDYSFILYSSSSSSSSLFFFKAEKYGAPGSTDREGFDPYADSVGAGCVCAPLKPTNRTLPQYIIYTTALLGHLRYLPLFLHVLFPSSNSHLRPYACAYLP